MSPPAAGQFVPGEPPTPAQPFLVPDIPEAVAAVPRVETRWFTLRVGVVAIADYTAFQQDDASVAQVGRQDDQWDARAARLMLRGAIGSSQAVSYLVAAEYQGFETDPEDTWQLTDLSLSVPLAGPATKLTVGKGKETFGYEMVGDAANLPHQERILSPFFVSRQVGLKVTQVIGPTHRMTASAGVFNDWFVSSRSFEASGTDVTARFTGLLWDQAGGTRFLHLGGAIRYAGADDNVMRYKGRPESNVTDAFVDSGTLAGDHAWHMGVEGLWNEGPFSLLAEFQRAEVDSPAAGNPAFLGYYLTASWILTGETRPYDRTVGYARRVMPTRRWGAPELVVRFSHVDLDDDPVAGGSFLKTSVGLNWWATRRWKLGFFWGHTCLDRFGIQGVADSYHSRLQWIF